MLVYIADQEVKVQIVLEQACLVPSVGLTVFSTFVSCYRHTHAIDITVWVSLHEIALESGQWLLGFIQDRIFKKA